jgi:hypothetical protein
MYLSLLAGVPNPVLTFFHTTPPFTQGTLDLDGKDNLPILSKLIFILNTVSTKISFIFFGDSRDGDK